MPLIKCPMCGADISPNAIACPHCGEPMKANQNIAAAAEEEPHVTYNMDIPMKYKVVLSGDLHQIIKLIKYVKELTGLGLKEAKDIVDSVPSDIILCNTYEEAVAVSEELKKIDQYAIVNIVECSDLAVANVEVSVTTDMNSVANNIAATNPMNPVSCPQCGSGKIKKMTFASIFGSSTDKKWKCNACGCKW